MSSKRNFELYDQLENLDEIPAIRNIPKKELRQRSCSRKTLTQPSHSDISNLAEQENELDFSYCASKHEKEWLVNSLSKFYSQKWFDNILRLIKGGGKEASIYQCLFHLQTGPLKTMRIFPAAGIELQCPKIG